MTVRVSARKLLMSGLAGAVLVVGGVGAAAWAGGQPKAPPVQTEVGTQAGELVQSAPPPAADRWVPQAPAMSMPALPRPEVGAEPTILPGPMPQPTPLVSPKMVEKGPSPAPVCVPVPAVTTPSPCSQPTVEEKTPEKPPVCMVNSRRIRLNYEIREVGPSGVARVELWATRDGRAWQRYFDERPSPGPLLVHVAEEGRYGFTILVKSGVGHCARAPRPGDAPQIWVEVDATKPVVQLSEVKVGKGADAGKLMLSWSGSDANLRPQAYTITYAVSKDGPWAPIASDLDKETTTYAWTMPKDVPYRFWVRIEATDKAGNVGTATTPEPVAVDPAQPKGVIVGVDVEPMSK